MQRRRVLSMGATVPLGAWAPQWAAAQTAKVKRLGILTIVPPSRARSQPLGLPMLVDGLRRLGWEEGRNLVLVFPSEATHDQGRNLDGAAVELVREQVDAIYCGHQIPASAALRATKTIPIVTWTSEAIELGFAKTLARPGGNVTGLVTLGHEEHGRVISLLREMRPGLSRVGFSVGRGVREWNAWFEAFVAVAKPAGLQVIALPGHFEPVSIEPMLAAASRERVQVLITGPVWWLNQHEEIWKQITAWAVENKVVTKGDITQRGQAMLTYGLNVEEGARIMSAQVDRVLRGANPAELPFVQPTRFDLVINQRRARAAGFPAPQSMLIQATEVIE